MRTIRNEDEPREDRGGGEAFDVPGCEVVANTTKAIKVRSAALPKRCEDPFTGRRELWVPNSCVHDDSEVYKFGDRGKLLLKAWFAEKEKL